MSRPLNVDESLYTEDSEALLLERLSDCRNPELNSISPSTLNELLNSQKSHIIIDCRFDYEYKGGHIKGAINFTDPKQIEQFFFSDKERIEDIMKNKTIIIFHCEFSQ